MSRLTMVVALALSLSLGVLVGMAEADEATFGFTWAAISSLHSYYTANLLRVEQSKLNPATSLEGYVAFMRSFEAQNRVLQVAASVIGPYKKDTRLLQMGRVAAEAMELEYLESIKINKEAATFISIITSNAPVPKGWMTDKTPQQRLVEIRSRRDAIDINLVQEVITVTYQILGLDEEGIRNAAKIIAERGLPKDTPLAKVIHLRITTSERRQLVARLEELFGPSVKKYVEKDETAAPGAAVNLWEWLTTQGFKAADEPDTADPRG